MEANALDFSTLTNTLSSQINGETVLTVFGAVVSATVGIFLITWGARKIIYGIQNSLKKGKMGV